MTATLPLSDIHIPENRQRKFFDQNKHIELCESLQHSAVGLQNALVVRQENEKIYLVSGERRLRAIADIYELGGTIKYAGKSIHSGLVPVVHVGDLSSLDRMEAEWEENYLRLDLTWQERAAATDALWKLRQAQAAASDQPAPTMQEFAREVNPRGVEEEKLEVRGDHMDLVKKDLILARHMDDPDVRSAKTAKEAVKILKRKEQTRKHEELAAIVGESFSSKKHTLLNQDSLEWMKSAEPEQFDVILTDPPYGMGADEFGDSGGKAAGSHGYEDSIVYWEEVIGIFARESFRLASTEAHLYCFLDIEKFPETKFVLEAAGWQVFRTPLIWHKPSGYRAPWPDRGPQRSYECILFAIKGERKVNFMKKDILTYNPDDNLGHAAQKPVALIKDLLSRSIQPGQKVFDPFCGTGPIFEAANELQCYAVGIEKDSASYGIAAERLKGLK